jgi:hypothetical protein
MTKQTCTARADYRTKCVSCGATPTVVLTDSNGRDIEKLELCGPCCFGEAACADPDEWASEPSPPQRSTEP